MRNVSDVLPVLVLGFCAVLPGRAATVWLDDLPIQTYSEGIRPVSAKTNYSHDPIRTRGQAFTRGVGAQTPCVVPLQLDGKARRFIATVGADDLGNRDIPVTFTVLGDRKILFTSGRMRVGDPARKIDVDLTGVQLLGLLVTDEIGGVANKRTYCDWADARLEMEDDARPRPQPNAPPGPILTPAPGPAPRINSASVFGARPGRPVLYTIAATGARPLRFAAAHLPAGLTLDPASGALRGSVATAGRYAIELTASNAHGTTTRELTLEIGDRIALTPPMGWNGWNSWEGEIDQEKVLASAEAMVATGLADHGWAYVNLDDTWQGRRGGPLDALQPNEKFPDLPGMVQRIHALGLKAGLYSTPYIQSYAGYVGGSSRQPHGGETRAGMSKRAEFRGIGPYRFEVNDAGQMAAWGFDFLKYDWRIDLVSAERMSAALHDCGRDIVFSLSNNAPFAHAAEWARVANMYRTGPDIRDSWTSLYLTSFSLEPWAPYSGPGHWIDPDMMILGLVKTGAPLHPTRLTPAEQYSHVSMYCLLSAPLLLGCPLERLDPFTLALLTNDEVLAIDQDPAGHLAHRAFARDGVEVWVKPLADGSAAIGLFATADFGHSPASYFRWGDEPPIAFTLRLRELGFTGDWVARDLWRQQDIAAADAVIQTTIPHHGVMLLRLRRR